MLKENDEFAELLERVLARDEDATKTFLDQYGEVVFKTVRRRLSQPMRSLFDSGDFAQEVWASFFADPPTGGQLQSPDELAARLILIARNKVINATRKRGGRLDKDHPERSLEHSAAEEAGRVLADQPTPSQAFSQSEEWDRLMDNQPPVYRRVLVLLREGKSLAEVAADMHLHTRTVRRILQSILPRENS